MCSTYINIKFLIAQFIYHSAGVGRSGTFIAIDTEIQRIERENVVDVYNCVRRMRFWRNFMVQTLVCSYILFTLKLWLTM